MQFNTESGWGVQQKGTKGGLLKDDCSHKAKKRFGWLKEQLPIGISAVENP
jgi:hypothetical protein